MASVLYRSRYVPCEGKYGPLRYELEGRRIRLAGGDVRPGMPASKEDRGERECGEGQRQEKDGDE